MAIPGKQTIKISERLMMLFRLFGKTFYITIKKTKQKSVVKMKHGRANKIRVHYSANPCPQCSFISNRKQGLAAHIRFKHKEAPVRKKYTPRYVQSPCNACSFVAATSQGLAAHKRLTHEGWTFKHAL